MLPLLHTALVPALLTARRYLRTQEAQGDDTEMEVADGEIREAAPPAVRAKKPGQTLHADSLRHVTPRRYSLQPSDSWPLPAPAGWRYRTIIWAA